MCLVLAGYVKVEFSPFLFNIHLIVIVVIIVNLYSAQVRLTLAVILVAYKWVALLMILFCVLFQ